MSFLEAAKTGGTITNTTTRAFMSEQLENSQNTQLEIQIQRLFQNALLMESRK